MFDYSTFRVFRVLLVSLVVPNPSQMIQPSMCTSQHVTMDAPSHEEAALTYHSRTEGRDETRLTAPVTRPLPAVSVSVSWPLPVVSHKHQQHVRGGKYTQGRGGGSIWTAGSEIIFA